jgi:hypothetical protein
VFSGCVSHVCSGSKADLGRRPGYVRSSFNSGHAATSSRLVKSGRWTISHHVRITNKQTFTLRSRPSLFLDLGFRALEPDPFALLVSLQKLNPGFRKDLLNGQNGGTSIIHHTLFQPGQGVQRDNSLVRTPGSFPFVIGMTSLRRK